MFQRGLAGVDDEVVLVINHALKMTTSHVEHEADTRRHALEEPNVRGRHSQFNVAHALAAHAGESDLHTTAVAYHTLVLDALVLAARAFPVFDWPEDALAKEPTLLRFECAVVDGLGILDFAFRPAPDGLRRGHADGDILHEVDLLETKQLARGISVAHNSLCLIIKLAGQHRHGVVGLGGVLNGVGVTDLYLEAKRLHLLHQHVERLGHGGVK